MGEDFLDQQMFSLHLQLSQGDNLAADNLGIVKMQWFSCMIVNMKWGMGDAWSLGSRCNKGFNYSMGFWRVQPSWLAVDESIPLPRDVFVGFVISRLAMKAQGRGRAHPSAGAYAAGMGKLSHGKARDPLKDS